MSFNKDDYRFTAYLNGELSGTELNEFEGLLETDKEAKSYLEELKSSNNLLSSMKETKNEFLLSPKKKAELLKMIEEDMPRKSWLSKLLIPTSTFAALALVFIVFKNNEPVGLHKVMNEDIATSSVVTDSFEEKEAALEEVKQEKVMAPAASLAPEVARTRAKSRGLQFGGSGRKGRAKKKVAPKKLKLMKMQMAEESFAAKDFKDTDRIEEEFIRERDDFYTATLNLNEDERDRVRNIENMVKEDLKKNGSAYRDIDICMLREMGYLDNANAASQKSFKATEKKFYYLLHGIIGESNLLKYKKWCKTYANKIKNEQ